MSATFQTKAEAAAFGGTRRRYRALLDNAADLAVHCLKVPGWSELGEFGVPRKELWLSQHGKHPEHQGSCQKSSRPVMLDRKLHAV